MAEGSKYQTLVRILDQIRQEAPPENRRYHAGANNEEALNQARARAFIHLYLKVNYGILDFAKREGFITDGPYDGGIDAYFIDAERRRVDFIQSKFRQTESNFVGKQITLQELLSMDVDRIAKGEKQNESGQEYNGKIKGLQRALEEVPDIGRYDYRVIILANLKAQPASALRKLTGGFHADIFDHGRAYSELVFPVISGTYYHQPTLCIALDVANSSSGSPRLGYSVDTAFRRCDISLVFVPTEEIGRIVYQYKNSVLKFNPRSYLELKNNTVNAAMARTIMENQTNEFALFNNGITILSDETHFGEFVGVKDRAQVVVTNPQILNGGQTAFTLSRLYEGRLRGEHPDEIFDRKEVLLKIITFDADSSEDPEERLRLVEDISKATNSQTPVTEADRRSNDKVQVDMQRELFEQYGRYYERKRGEFADGVRDGYIERSQIIDREDFLRVCMSCDFMPSQARRSSSTVLFREENFCETLTDTSRIDEYYFAYRCLEELNGIEKRMRHAGDPWGSSRYGQALRYGKFAVVAVCANRLEDIDPDHAAAQAESVLGEWLAFEEHAISRADNQAYFARFTDADTGDVRELVNFDGYYKGRTLNADLKRFFL